MTRPTYHTWQSLFLYYIVQVVNSQRGYHAVIALLHRRSGGHRHDPGQCELANVPKVGKCVKFSQITLHTLVEITEFYMSSCTHVLQGNGSRKCDICLLVKKFLCHVQLIIIKIMFYYFLHVMYTVCILHVMVKSIFVFF